MSRVSRAVLETLAKCPSAVMRETLMAEAAQLLHVPVSALQEDLGKMGKGGPRSSASAPTPTSSLEEADAQERDPPNHDAAAPENNPPSARERTFCEFLFDHEHDGSLLPLVEEYAVDAVLPHPFTRRFVAAWRAGCSDGSSLESLLDALPSAECAWLNEILMANSKSVLSELTPVQILKNFLRQFWMEAVRRRQGMLSVDSSPENDLLRLNYSTCIRRLQRDSWEKASALMTPNVLS